MDIRRSIENTIVAKLSDIVYISRTNNPIFAQPFCHDGHMYLKTAQANQVVYKNAVSRETRNDFIIHPDLSGVIMKKTLSDPTRTYIRDIHNGIYNHSHEVTRTFSTTHIAAALLGNLDEIYAGLHSEDKQQLGKPFILCHPDFIQTIVDNAYNYKFVKDKYADMYDETCEHIRRYGKISVRRKTFMVYVDLHIKDPHEIILGLQSTQESIGTKLCYYQIYGMLNEHLQAESGWMMFEPIPNSNYFFFRTTSRHTILNTGYEEQIYYKLKFAPPQEKSEEEKKREEFEQRINYIVNH